MHADNDGLGDHTLVLVAGLAGSGKTEAGKLLAGATGWALLDKDTLTRTLVEATLEALGDDPNTRESNLYLNKVRPLEYECLMRTCWENIECGTSVIAAAPFLREVSDSSWLDKTMLRCRYHGAHLTVVWVQSDEESLRERLLLRGAARDTWKLAHWDQWLQTMDLALCPSGSHIALDNRMASKRPLAHQIDEVAISLGTNP